jgi:hypothetical protein
MERVTWRFYSCIKSFPVLHVGQVTVDRNTELSTLAHVSITLSLNNHPLGILKSEFQTKHIFP